MMHRPEELIGKLCEAGIVLAEGASTSEACRPGRCQRPRFSALGHR